MSPVASLEDLMAYMETAIELEDYRAYFDRQSARIVTLDESTIKAVEKGHSESAGDIEDWEKEEMETAREIVNDKTGRFIQPPDKSLFDEHHYMAGFIKTVPDARIAAKLTSTLQKRGSFRIFQQRSFVTVLYQFGLEEQWYEYLANAMKQFVIEWAKTNNVPYEDDLKMKKE